MQILACNKKQNSNCKDKVEIDSLFEKLHFTLYNLYQRIEFVNSEDEHDKHDRIMTHNYQQQQFTISSDQYKDNNNFVRINKVEITENRWYFSGRITH